MQSILARSPLLRQQAARAARRVQARGAHADHSPVPFSFHSKPAFAAKTIAYLVGGFSIPFVAAAYQLKKSGAGAQD
ncbi:hypothetical protein GLOTRDRAFT_125586 [Gloeophyllum trabeum ATCC 11539]|uniref:Cytochrome c oxidase subunit 8, mitochondrial n=1 Tax=Gloeophyllum trabeum (strain ATCC 11539 / FP-39264 / Madison 617) TaxID=670483 RepID=S7RWK6_GLOTA|nr:uncharacterized protein GLOTRDRAFT_125586 [Gloeophyllum trabeum ATCC 11539]EPQ59280.1 hypothetical protein GLOTRDRAFT_125586 [Gloeophyllum trabeum ATCC 11539]